MSPVLEQIIEHYGFFRMGGTGEARRAIADLEAAGIQARTDCETVFWQDPEGNPEARFARGLLRCRPGTAAERDYTHGRSSRVRCAR